MKKVLKIVILLLLFSTFCFSKYQVSYAKSGILIPNEWKKNFEKKIYKDYSYKVSEVFDNVDYIPQGLCPSSYKGKYYKLITAYYWRDKDTTKNAVIYIINDQNKLSKRVYLNTKKDIANKEGEMETPSNHSGGICEYNGKIYISSTNFLFYINKKDLFEAEDKSTLKINDHFGAYANPTDRNLSFCTPMPSATEQGKNVGIWVGEHKEIEDLEDFEAFIFGQYPKANLFYEQNKYLILQAQMDIPYKVQGMAFAKGTQKVVFTQNGATLEDYSKLIVYDYSVKAPEKGKKTYTYGINKKLHDFIIPAFAQNIYISTAGDVYIIFESGSKAFLKKHTFGSLAWAENRVVLYNIPDNIKLVDYK